MTNGNADHRMTAEEFDLVASMILLEGGHNRKALRDLSCQVTSKCSVDLVDYFRFISGRANKNIPPVQQRTDSSLSKLCEGFRLLHDEGDPAKAVSYFLSAFKLGLGSKLNYWIPLGLFGIGASCLRIQRFDLARDSFLRCVECGWAFNNHSAIAQGFGGLGNVFMAARLPHLAFDTYSTDLGFIQTNHYFIPILRVRRSLAYAMTQEKERGLEMLLAETGDFFEEDHVSTAEKKRYQTTAEDEVYRGLAACSVVWKDSQTFDLLPKPEKRGANPLSVIAYHLAAMYHHVERRAYHLCNARKAFKELAWNEHPVRCWLDSLLSEETLDTRLVPRPQPNNHDILLPQLGVPALSFLNRFRELKMDDAWSDLDNYTPLEDAITFTLERGMLSNSR